MKKGAETPFFIPIILTNLRKNYYFRISKMFFMKYIVVFLLLISHLGFSQNTVPFQIYNQKGKKVSTKKFLKELEKSEIILFGEYHDNPIVHWLQLKTVQYLHSFSPVSLGGEMFESHQQKAINSYLNQEIDQVGLDSMVQLWPNYKTDYKPLLDFAKQKNIPFVATNIPREYASYVYRNGLEALQEHLDTEEKNRVAPLPIAYDPNLPGYQAMTEMMGPGHTPNPNFPKAQAIKDATMAYFIYQHYKNNHQQFIHFNGDYHSKNFEGIYWYLKKLDENLNIKVISTVEQKDVKKLQEEFRGQGDFIIVVDSEMTKTH